MKKEIVKQLPKIELHCHLDGAVRPHILEELAEQQGVKLDYHGQELAEKLIAPKECQSLGEYLERFDLVLPLLQQKAALELIAFDLIEQVSLENVAYIEVRFAPMLFTHQGLTIDEIIDSILAGLKRGEETFGVKSNALLCAMRHHTDEVNKTVVEATRHYLGHGVVGFDLAGDEASYPANLYAAIVKLGRSYGIPITLHAGECGCPQNVVESIRLGATRIGHGIAISQDQAAMDLCLANGTLIEMCPTSNFQTKAVTTIADFPFEKFLEMGLNICINTDNRTVSNTTLTEEYMKLFDWYQIDYACMEQLNHNAVAGAFLDSAAKKVLHDQLTSSYAPYVIN